MASAQKLHQTGITQFRAGNPEAALTTLQEAIKEAPQDSRLAAEIYNDLGVIYRELDDFDAAYESLEEAMTRFTEIDDQKGQAQTVGNLGAVLEAEEDYEEAVKAYKQSAKMLEALGESEMAMYVWQAVSRLRTRQGQYIAAIGAYEEGVENMPEGSFKRKVLQKILSAPSKLLGGPGTSSSKDDPSDKGE